MKVLISAAEPSADIHGAALVRSLHRAVGDFRIAGIGGADLQAMGLEVVVDARSLAVMGFTEVLTQLPRIFSALKKVETFAEEFKPDVAVLIDFPDFHFLLARRLKKLGIPLVYYIPPKVWVWRKYRVRFLQNHFKSLLCILPFEEAFYRRNQIRAKYVGNPLMKELPLDLTPELARQKVGVQADEKVLVLMPGSRRAEVEQHLGVMLDAARGSVPELRKTGDLSATEMLTVLLPVPKNYSLMEITERVKQWFEQIGDATAAGIKVNISQGNSAECLVAADAALVKSGTSTLEAGLLGCPHALVYRPNPVSGWLFKNLVRYRGAVGLVNLILQSRDGRADLLIPEILNDEVTAQRLQDQIVALLANPGLRLRMFEGFKELRQEMTLKGAGDPSMQAAMEVVRVIQEARQRA